MLSPGLLGQMGLAHDPTTFALDFDLEIWQYPESLEPSDMTIAIIRW
jgi:hypothetical protein